MKGIFKYLLFIVLSIFLSGQLSASSVFSSIEKKGARVYELANGVDDVVDLTKYLKNKGYDLFEEIDNVLFLRGQNGKIGKILDKTKPDDIKWFQPKLGGTWRIHETNTTNYLKFKYGDNVASQVKVRTYNKNGDFVDGYLDDLVLTKNREFIIIDAKHSQKAKIVDGKMPGYTNGQKKSYQWISDGDAVKIEIIGDGATDIGLMRGTDILPRLKGKVQVITNNSKGELVEMTINRTGK